MSDQTREDIILVAVVQVVDVGRREGGVVVCCSQISTSFSGCSMPGKDARGLP